MPVSGLTALVKRLISSDSPPQGCGQGLLSEGSPTTQWTHSQTPPPSRYPQLQIFLVALSREPCLNEDTDLGFLLKCRL